MDVQVRELAARQADLFAAWQLRERGWNRDAIRHRVENHAWRVVRSGVLALTQSPLTQEQLWWAAVLTAPATFLGDRSGANCWGFTDFKLGEETVVRPGSGGPRHLDGVLVRRSKLLPGETTTRDGLPITSAARTLIDISPGLSRLAVARAFREAVRVRATTIADIVATLLRHPGRRGTRVLWDLVKRYSALPYHRCRSNAEARALEVLHDAELAPDKVNAVVAGSEADLIWFERRLIIEIDGPQYHLFLAEDAAKQARWERAGYTVRRISSDVVYRSPEALIALAAT